MYNVYQSIYTRIVVYLCPYCLYTCITYVLIVYYYLRVCGTK
jgi:hypothetical protein